GHGRRLVGDPPAVGMCTGLSAGHARHGSWHGPNRATRQSRARRHCGRRRSVLERQHRYREGVVTMMGSGLLLFVMIVMMLVMCGGMIGGLLFATRRRT